MFAQALAEYGLLTAIFSAAEKFVYAANDWVRNAGPAMWLVIGATALLLLRFLLRRRGV